MKKTTKKRSTTTNKKKTVKKKTPATKPAPDAAASPSPDAAPETAPLEEPRRPGPPSLDESRTVEERKSELLAALADALGIALFACKRAGVRYEDYLQWRKDDPEFTRRADLVAERAIDFVEGKAFEEIKKGNARLIQFYLQTKGRARGYARDFAKEPPAATTTSPLAFLTEDEMQY